MTNCNNKKLRGCIAGLSLALVTACGGGGGGSAPAPIPTATPGPTPTPSPTPTPAPISCTGLDLLDIAATSADQSAATFSAANAIDDDLGPAARWESGAGSGALTLDLGKPYLIKDIGIAWHLGDTRTASFTLATSSDGTTFQSQGSALQSRGDTLLFERYPITGTTARYVRIAATGTSTGAPVAIAEAAVFGCEANPAPISTATFDTSIFGLNPSATPGANFDLLGWALDTPATDPGDGFAQRTQEGELATFSDQYFFTHTDGGMRFRSTIAGATTSANSRFTRSELREMLRRGDRSISTQGVNRNNWVLGYQPDPGVPVGGRGGVLKGTLAINHVTETGTDFQIGRMVFGQIHASSDEPIRLYYRKYPENTRGYVYFAHEIRGADDIYFMVLGPSFGDRDSQPEVRADPHNGIALDEVFSYEIIQAGSRIDVILRRGDQDGEIIGHNFVDMAAENSGYDTLDEWNYFKAGVYTQNNTGDGADFDMATFYRLSNTHD